jgi:CheY-like chemotaxis protein
MAMHELRRHKRISYNEQVLINRVVKAPCLSLSEGGLFVSTGYHFPVNSVLDLDLLLNREAIKAKAQVRHTQKDVGVGLMFQCLAPDVTEIIKSYVYMRHSAETGMTSKAILHIDPDPLKRRLYKGKLVGDGYVVYEAGDSAEALGIMQQRKIDLVITELYIGETDNLDLIMRIKADPARRRMPIVVLASKSVFHDITRAKEAGACEFLHKMTTTPVALSGVVKKHLSKPAAS